MTDLKRAAEALVKILDEPEPFDEPRHRLLDRKSRYKRALEALRDALQREEPAPNAVITNCISYDRVLHKAEVEAHWGGYKAELQREESQKESNPYPWVDKTVVRVPGIGKEPKVEVPFKLPLRFDGRATITDADGEIVLQDMGMANCDAEALVALANRAAPSDAGRGLSRPTLELATKILMRLHDRDLWNLAREVLGKKEGE